MQLLAGKQRCFQGVVDHEESVSDGPVRALFVVSKQRFASKVTPLVWQPTHMTALRLCRPVPVWRNGFVREPCSFFC